MKEIRKEGRKRERERERERKAIRKAAKCTSVQSVDKTLKRVISPF